MSGAPSQPRFVPGVKKVPGGWRGFLELNGKEVWKSEIVRKKRELAAEDALLEAQEK